MGQVLPRTTQPLWCPVAAIIVGWLVLVLTGATSS